MTDRAPAGTPSLWVIDPSVRHPESQGVAEVLGDWSGTHRLFRPALHRGDGPDPGAGYDVSGIVVMGSAASVHDVDLPWLVGLSDWLRPVVAGQVRVPLFGICFGHQLIAHLAGGQVGFLDDGGREKLLGVQHTRLDRSRLLPDRSGLDVVVSHREEVKRLPEGYRIVASREAVPVDGIEHVDRPVFGFQFHPEARDEFARHAGIDSASITDEVRRGSRALLAAFRECVARSATSADAP